MVDHDQNERILKLLKFNYNEANKIIFNWVKAGDINVKQFTQLCEINQQLPKA